MKAPVPVFIRVLLVSTMLVLCLPSQAQVPIDNVTEEVTFEGDQGFHLHTVLQGQTLYSIARAYGVRMTAVNKHNPKAVYGLLVGQQLKIPASAEAVERARLVSASLDEPKAEPEQEQEPEAEPGQEPETKSNAGLASETDSEPEAEITAEAELAVESATESASEPEPETVAVGEPAVEQAADKPTPGPVPVPETDSPAAAADVVEPVARNRNERLDDIALPPPDPEPEAAPVPAPTPIPEDSIILPRYEEPELMAIPEPDTTQRDSFAYQELFQPKEVTVEETPLYASFDPRTNAYATEGFSLALLDTNALLEILAEKYRAYYSDTANPDGFRFKEQFYFYLNQEGTVLALEDQRTELNENTQYLDQEDFPRLYQLNFSVKTADGQVVRSPLSLELELTRTDYKAKVSKTRIRIYRSPLYVEYLPENHPHFALLMREAQLSGTKGRVVASVVSGKLRVAHMSEKEFNPFYHVEALLWDGNHHAVLSFREGK